MSPNMAAALNMLVMWMPQPTTSGLIAKDDAQACHDGSNREPFDFSATVSDEPDMCAVA